MNSIERKVLESLDVEGMLLYLRELVSIPSYGGLESQAQRNFAKKLEEVGLEVDLWELNFEKLKKHPSFSMSITRDEGLGVVGVLGGTGSERSLILNGHIDTVEVGEKANWSHPPLKPIIKDGKVYGRGTADMKGGLCCALFAAKAIIDAGVTLKGNLLVESVIGEEDGGVGALATVLRGYDGDAAIVMEPTELKVSPAHSGALAFRVDVKGRSAHACVRNEGVSAIEKFIFLFNALHDLEKDRNKKVNDPLYANYSIPFPLNIGTVHGGNWPGSVPEKLTFQGRIGVMVGENVEYVRGVVEETIKKASKADSWLKKHPPSVEWSGYQFDSACTPTNHPIVSAICAAHNDVTGQQAKLEGMTYASDMRHLVNTGNIPTILYGPGNVIHAHAPDEYVKVDELVTVAKTLALSALRFCGIESI